MLRRAMVFAALCAGCGSSDSSSPPPGGSAGSGGSTSDAAVEDQSAEAAPDTSTGEDAPQPPPESGPDADQPDQQIPGAELVIEQIHLPTSMAEAAVVVGPDGTTVLIDTGGTTHASTIRAAIERNAGSAAVDWVVVTHFHEDHQEGFDAIFTGSSPATLKKGVITRGLLDFGADNIGSSGFQKLCGWLTDPSHASQRFDLCSGPAQASCTGGTDGAPWPATSCDGLRKGVLDDPGDDGASRLSTINLGSGAQLIFFAADAWVAGDTGVQSLEAGGLTVGWGGNGPENGRSIAAVLRWGNFSYVLAGDMTGEGASDNPKVEQGVAAAGPGMLYQPGGSAVFLAGATDVVHVSHHGYASSMWQEWLDWLMPADGQARNAVIGCNKGYALAPTPKMLTRVSARVGGGNIWVTEPGLGASTNPKLVNANGGVVVRVSEQGSKYYVAPLTSQGEGPASQFDSTVP